MRVPDDHRFDATSPVGAYWLVHGVGFAVCRDDGHELGVVEDVVVDPLSQRAELVILRRRGVLRRREELDPSIVQAVVPASQLFLVGSPASNAVERPPVERGAAGAAVRRGAAATRPVVVEVVRRLGVLLAAAGRRARRAAVVGVALTTRAAERARREAPALESWLAARARAAGRASATAARRLDRSARAAALHLATLARLSGRLLRELTVLAAVVAVAIWRRARGPSGGRHPVEPAEDGAAGAPEIPPDPGGQPPPPDGRRRAATTRRAGSTHRPDG